MRAPLRQASHEAVRTVRTPADAGVLLRNCCASVVPYALGETNGQISTLPVSNSNGFCPCARSLLIGKNVPLASAASTSSALVIGLKLGANATAWLYTRTMTFQ